MKKSFTALMIIMFAFSFFTSKSFSQEDVKKDSVKITAVAVQPEPAIKKERKNTILVNVTNPVLISTKFFTVSYERVLPNNQSFTVSLGSFSIPKFFNLGDSVLSLDTDYKDKGFHFSADYRFYLQKENKYKAPRGIYIGPYYAFNTMQREITWYMDGNVQEVNTNLNLNIHTLGFELGYQFVFWDKVSLDMILFGPGFGSYKVNTEIKTNLGDNETEFFEKLNDFLEERLPGYDWVVEPGDFKRTGSFKTWDLGYRYTVRIGYRF